MTEPCPWCGTEISDEYHPEDSTRCHELDGAKHDQLRCQTVMRRELTALRLELIASIGQEQEWVPRELYEHARFMAAGWRRLVKVRDGQLEDEYYAAFEDPDDV